MSKNLPLIEAKAFVGEDEESTKMFLRFPKHVEPFGNEMKISICDYDEFFSVNNLEWNYMVFESIPPPEEEDDDDEGISDFDLFGNMN